MFYTYICRYNLDNLDSFEMQPIFNWYLIFLPRNSLQLGSSYLKYNIYGYDIYISLIHKYMIYMYNT